MDYKSKKSGIKKNQHSYQWKKALTFTSLFTCLIIFGTSPFQERKITNKFPKHTKGQKKNGIYIWQRNWKNTELKKAVERDPDYDYFFLAGEFHKNKIIRIQPKDYFFSLPNRIVPVFRIHLDIFKKYINEPEKLSEIILNEFVNIARSCRKIDEVQLDLDCPESKLMNFGRLLKSLRKKLPIEYRLSFTSLPCHLNHPEFREIAKFADYYVLQVHGIEYPKHINEKVEILNLQVARAAIRNAERNRLDFKIALPTYAYQLNFDRKSGKFLFLNAEKIPPEKPNIISRIITPNFKDAVSIVKRFNNSKIKHCNGLIWFRLPVKGDRLNLDYETLSLLQDGSIPERKISAKWDKDETGTYKLFVKNHGILKKGELQINIDWENEKGIYDLFRGFKSANENNISKMPVSIVGEIPPPGQSTPAGWFRINNQKIPNIEIKFKL